MTARDSGLTTKDGLTIYDLDVYAADLWCVAGPPGWDPALIDCDALPAGFRWVECEEWEEASNRYRREVGS